MNSVPVESMRPFYTAKGWAIVDTRTSKRVLGAGPFDTKEEAEDYISNYLFGELFDEDGRE